MVDLSALNGSNYNKHQRKTFRATPLLPGHQIDPVTLRAEFRPVGAAA